MIEKTAKKQENYYRPLYFYESARAGFKDILSFLCDDRTTLLLPAYIGFSPKEGSGIYDPVVHSGIKHIFYPMDKALHIDVKAFSDILSSVQGKAAVLLVHYFGYPDINYDTIVTLSHSLGATVIEDAAHALFTDFVDHRCGQRGDYVIYSLHKMLPFENGGMTRVNSPKCTFVPKLSIETDKSPFLYDLSEIAAKRKKNAKLWDRMLKGIDSIKILRPYSEDVTPQTFPIIICGHDRNDLYFRLNGEGFGAVSLYHTMIDPIKNGGYTDSFWLSQHIINMPVHQDADENDIREMAAALLRLVNE